VESRENHHRLPVDQGRVLANLIYLGLAARTRARQAGSRLNRADRFLSSRKASISAGVNIHDLYSDKKNRLGGVAGVVSVDSSFWGDFMVQY
jgi:hypothetical protein